MTPFFDQYEHTMTVDPQSVRMATDWGVVRGDNTHVARSKATGQRTRRTGKFLSVVEKQGDGK